MRRSYPARPPARADIAAISPRLHRVLTRRSVARREHGAIVTQLAVEAGVIEVAELRLDPATLQAYIDGASAGLTRTEFRLLYALAADQGSVVSRRELLERVWGNRARRERAVDDVVQTLRAKIDRRAPRHAFLHTRPRVGYQIEPRAKHG